MTLAAIDTLHCYSRFLHTLEVDKVFIILKKIYHFVINIFNIYLSSNIVLEYNNIDLVWLFWVGYQIWKKNQQTVNLI